LPQDPAERQDFGDMRQRLEKEVLFQIQGVGSIKNVQGLEVYVKNEHCEEAIRELSKLLKQESLSKMPMIKHILGAWKFL